MFFTRIGWVFAHILFWYGLLGVAFALYQGLSADQAAHGTKAISTYLIGEVGEGMTRAFFGLALGVLCEISAARDRAEG